MRETSVCAVVDMLADERAVLEKQPVCNKHTHTHVMYRLRCIYVNVLRRCIYVDVSRRVVSHSFMSGLQKAGVAATAGVTRLRKIMLVFVYLVRDEVDRANAQRFQKRKRNQDSHSGNTGFKSISANAGIAAVCFTSRARRKKQPASQSSNIASVRVLGFIFFYETSWKTYDNFFFYNILQNF